MKFGKILLVALIGVFISFNAYADAFKVICASPDDIDEKIDSFQHKKTKSGGIMIINGITNISSPSLNNDQVCVTVTFVN